MSQRFVLGLSSLFDDGTGNKPQGFEGLGDFFLPPNEKNSGLGIVH